MEIKSTLESKYGALRGHLTFEYQVILIGTRASDQPSDGVFLSSVSQTDDFYSISWNVTSSCVRQKVRQFAVDTGSLVISGSTY